MQVNNKTLVNIDLRGEEHVFHLIDKVIYKTWEVFYLVLATPPHFVLSNSLEYA